MVQEPFARRYAAILAVGIEREQPSLTRVDRLAWCAICTMALTATYRIYSIRSRGGGGFYLLKLIYRPGF